jgi:NADH-quinone oxidoreductase subunit H
VLLVAFLVPDRKVEGPAPIEPASDYPVPPLDLAVPTAPRHRLRPRRVDIGFDAAAGRRLRPASGPVSPGTGP